MKNSEEQPGHDYLRLDDGSLLEQCQVDTYRASGPGGQKRNKTSSAVRLRHGPTELMATASESRSQHENRQRALVRLRRAIALSCRHHRRPSEALPEYLSEALARSPGLRVNRKHDDYWRIIQYILDIFVADKAAVGPTAERLGISTGQLIRFLKNDAKLWERVNQYRREFGQPPLR